jgi:hypothetical protein
MLPGLIVSAGDMISNGGGFFATLERIAEAGTQALRWSEKWPIFGPCVHHQNLLYLYINNPIKIAI